MLNFLRSVSSIIYGFAVSIRNALYDNKILKSKEVDIPTIVLGNITVGGTGKTPHAEYVIDLLQKNFNIALLSRGYKRRTKGFKYVEPTSAAEYVGDEPLQIKRKFPNILVAVDANRIRGINFISKKNPDTNLIILDDAFQYRRLKPSISILLCDYNRPINKDKMLPLGNLRDNVKQKSRADIVVITKCPPKVRPIDIRVMGQELNLFPYQQIFFSAIEFGKLIPIFGYHDIFTTNKISAIAGIADPKSFFDHIEKNMSKPITITYPDHHAFTKDDFENISKLIDSAEIFITTEKDAMRILSFKGFTEQQKTKMFYIPIKVKILNNEEQLFTKIINEHVRKNQINSKLHTK